MDMPSFHSLFTVVLFVIFIGIVLWAWSSHRRQAFDEAANLPFADEETARKSATTTGENRA